MPITSSVVALITSIGSAPVGSTHSPPMKTLSRDLNLCRRCHSRSSSMLFANASAWTEASAISDIAYPL